MFCESWILKYTSFICIYILIINAVEFGSIHHTCISDNVGSCFNESFRLWVLSAGSFWPGSFRSNFGDGMILPYKLVELFRFWIIFAYFK